MGNNHHAAAGGFATRERTYRQRLTRQMLDGEAHFDDHSVGEQSRDAFRRDWIAPQCAVMEWYLRYLEQRHGASPASLSPFLELGGFSAHLSGFLASRHQLRGVCSDLDGAIPRRFAHDFFPWLGLRSDGVQFASIDAESLPFASGSLGFVFAFSTIHHFENPAKCLSEIRRVLRPGGVFLCAWEPLQPLCRPDRHPTDRSEVSEGLIENVFTLAEWDRLMRGAFPQFESAPLCALRTPESLRWLRPVLPRLPRECHRQIARLLGGIDYSALAIR